MCNTYQSSLPDILETSSFFKNEEIELLSKKPLPQHVAIIPDGNRRWAKRQSQPILSGYLQGAQTLIKTALAAKEMGLKELTMYTFSTENWKRSPDEIDLVMELLDIHLNHYTQCLVNASIRLFTIGNTEKLPSFLQKTLKKITKATEKGTSLDLILALNYGGRDELIRAFKKVTSNEPKNFVITEKEISQALDTAQWKDPDLIIRTSGEERLSNFLLWQSSYSEMYTEDVNWPDFTPHHLFRAVYAYQARKRRLGKD